MVIRVLWFDDGNYPDWSNCLSELYPFLIFHLYFIYMKLTIIDIATLKDLKADSLTFMIKINICF